MDVAGGRYALDKNGIDTDAHNNEEALKRQHKQGLQVIVSHRAPFRGILSRGEKTLSGILQYPG